MRRDAKGTPFGAMRPVGDFSSTPPPLAPFPQRTHPAGTTAKALDALLIAAPADKRLPVDIKANGALVHTHAVEHKALTAIVTGSQRARPAKVGLGEKVSMDPTKKVLF